MFYQVYNSITVKLEGIWTSRTLYHLTQLEEGLPLPEYLLFFELLRNNPTNFDQIVFSWLSSSHFFSLSGTLL